MMTWLMPSISMPRAAMSVAMSTGARPERKLFRALTRWLWLLLPWMAEALMPAAASARTTLSAPCLVRVKTSVRAIVVSVRSR